MVGIGIGIENPACSLRPSLICPADESDSEELPKTRTGLRPVALLVFGVACFLGAVGNLFGDEVVFKDGTRLRVEKLEIGESEVAYVVDGLRAYVPVAYIDLEKTRENLGGEKEAEAGVKPLPLPVCLVPDGPLSPPAARKGAITGDEALKLIGEWEKDIEIQLGALFKDLPPERRELVVPFKRAEGLIVLEGTLNGRLPARFVLDTGAAASSVTRETARRAGIRMQKGARITIATASGATQAEWGTLDTLRLGEMVLRNVPVLVVDGAPDNLIGENLIAHFVVTLDFTASRVTLSLP